MQDLIVVPLFDFPLIKSATFSKYWNALSYIMGYLKKIMHYGLFKKYHPTTIEGFSDADWNSESDDSYSTTSYVFTLGG